MSVVVKKLDYKPDRKDIFMKQINKVMIAAIMLFITGQTVAAARVKPVAYDTYEKYGMPAEAVGAQESAPEESWVRYIREPKAKPEVYDPYKQYGMPEEAVVGKKSEENVPAPEQSSGRYIKRNSNIKPRKLYQIEQAE